jgi:hypothetical protein
LLLKIEIAFTYLDKEAKEKFREYEKIFSRVTLRSWLKIPYFRGCHAKFKHEEHEGGHEAHEEDSSLTKTHTFFFVSFIPSCSS